MFDEILDAAAVLDELDDAARVEAWASSVLGVWAEAPDAREIDRELVDWLASSAHPHAPAVLLAVSSLVPVDPATARAAIEALAGGTPRWVAHLGTSQPTRAWEVHRHGTVSVGIGFVSSDTSEHSLLADVVEGELASLIVAPGPDALFDGSEDLVDPVSVPSRAAAERVVDAWRALLAGQDVIPESVHVNGAVARVRLGGVVGDPLDDLAVAPVDDGTWHDDLDPAERADSDRWACAVLDGALGPAADDEPTAADVPLLDQLADLLRPERIVHQPAVEREAFGALEWADWLGMVIGLVRAGEGTIVTPAAMVDAINRCAEVTSSIPRRDRPYYEWVMSLVLPVWRRGGLVDGEDRLSNDGVRLLPAALRAAWTPRD